MTPDSSLLLGRHATLVQLLFPGSPTPAPQQNCLGHWNQERVRKSHEATGRVVGAQGQAPEQENATRKAISPGSSTVHKLLNFVSLCFLILAFATLTFPLSFS